MTAERVEMIRQRLTDALQPESLDIEDDSASHAGHASAGGGGHFNVIIVSDRFTDLNLIKRHRLVYEAVDDMMNTEIHALSIKAYSPGEF
ncbi:MAG: BolA family transcriptional regulator [Gammaproteobacteria bacterium]|nr:MAG: BolA family transcriptional regulator [Gammaproteobacteria bacterium]